MIVALVSDLLFHSKITATAAQVGRPVRVLRTADAARAALAQAAGLIVDLSAEAGDPVELIRAARADRPELPIVAFVSHVQADLAQRAADAGASDVLPRSRFTQELGRILITLGAANTADSEGRST